VISAGEACTAPLVRTWARGRKFFDAYGPTEATIWSTVARHSENVGTPHIGRPIANTELYILDQHLQPLPVGVSGQLHIAGPGLARGYLRQPTLTAEKFIPHPFSSQAGARLYRSGDLARYRADGNIEFLGRSDHQVKLRGYRIELGEIETALVEHEAIQKAVVVAHEGTAGNTRLVAYIVTNTEVPLSDTELRTYMKARQPEYMVPSAFVQLEELPLTANGKVDRRALAAPEFSITVAGSHVAPRTRIEESLARIWCDVLRLDQVGINDNFFELGGDSILSLQIISRANKDGLLLSPRHLFEQPTIAALAAVVGSTGGARAEQGIVSGTLPLTPVQHWFFDQQMVDPHHFNQAVMLEVRQPLDTALLEQAMKVIVEHHDALRLHFHRGADAWQQINAEVEDHRFFEQVNLRNVAHEQLSVALEEAASRAQASLDLGHGPVMRLIYFDLGAPRSARLLWVVHHLAVDGVSWRILVEDLQTVYAQLRSNQPARLGAKTTSYKQWAEQMVEYARSEDVREQVSYWTTARREQVGGLPVDTIGAENSRDSTSVVTVELEAEQTRALLQEVPQVYHTQINDVLLTALALCLTGWSGEAGHLIDLEGHGREDIFESVDVSRTVGWFTSIYPVRLEVRPHPGSNAQASALTQIKELLREVPQRGIGYGLLKYLSPDEELRERMQKVPGAEISFNYLGQVDQAVAKDSPFAIAAEPSGATQSSRGKRRYLLEINGIVTAGRLRLVWTYNSNVHRGKTIQAVAEDYIRQLQRLVRHCQSPEAGGYTPSDFPKANLTQEQLDELLAELQ
jgi:non-ribosomal peptide synthase protein (TIGR01720 family)